ncbi:unnamed protein product [Urochloa decumbens]|uniref:Uncharacterized protein n=1 Tax=Urochloa decumbens TaxID=240449 RepID=A0ABC8WDW9_9POAL
MSANGMSRVFTPVVQGKDQQGSMNKMQNYNTGNNTSFPVTGAFFTGGSFLSGNSVDAPPPPQSNKNALTSRRRRRRAQAILPLASGEIPASDGAVPQEGLPAISLN